MRGELWDSRLPQGTLRAVGEWGSPKPLALRGSASSCILLWDVRIWELIACPPSRLAQQSAFGDGLWGPCPFPPGSIPSQICPLPGLVLEHHLPAMLREGLSPAVLTLWRDNPPPRSAPSWGGVPGGRLATASITSCFASSLLTETKGKDAIATQCQDAEHQAVPSR